MHRSKQRFHSTTPSARKGHPPFAERNLWNIGEVTADLNPA
jgi:hypothetical protein